MNRWDGRAAALEHNVGEHTAPEIQEVCVCVCVCVIFLSYVTIRDQMIEEFVSQFLRFFFNFQQSL